MTRFCHALASCFLVAAVVPGQDADGFPMVRLGLHNGEHVMQVRAFADGAVVLAVGAMATPPIRFGNIELNVTPQAVLPLGMFANGETRVLPVPRHLRDWYAEAVFVDAEWRLHDSNVVALRDAYADMVDATFHAELVSTDGLPPEYTLGASLTAPTSGYEFAADGHQMVDGKTAHVYLRLIEPGADEITLPVLTRCVQAVELGQLEAGMTVNVYLLRITRGSPGPEVYRLMLRLPVQ